LALKRLGVEDGAALEEVVELEEETLLLVAELAGAAFPHEARRATRNKPETVRAILDFII
jgi:hypothetical protein